MKKLVAILLLLVLVTSFVACAENDGTPEGMYDVATENATFFLYVPENWLTQSQGGVCGAMSPLGDANVIATTYLADTYYTPVTFWDTKCKTEYATIFTEFTVVDAECAATTLGGMNAHKYVFTAKLGGVAYKYMQVIAVDSNMVYTLQYTAPIDSYATNLEDVEAIRANFTLR